VQRNRIGAYNADNYTLGLCLASQTRRKELTLRIGRTGSPVGNHNMLGVLGNCVLSCARGISKSCRFTSTKVGDQAMWTTEPKLVVAVGLLGAALIACGTSRSGGAPQDRSLTTEMKAEAMSAPVGSGVVKLACKIKEIEWVKNKNGGCVGRYALAVSALGDDKMAVHVEAEPMCGYSKILGYICDSRHQTDCDGSAWSCCRSSGIQKSVDLVVGRRPRVVLISVHVPRQLQAACDGYHYEKEDHVPSNRMNLTLGYIPANRFKSPQVWPEADDSQRTVDTPEVQSFALCWQEG
jgi:hypothetical protein